MRAVALTKQRCKTLFKEKLKLQEFNFFKTNQEAFKAVWKSQNHEFWIKLTTSLRDEVYAHAYYNAENSDIVFIEFLKKMVGKSFSALVVHVTSIGNKAENLQDPDSEPEDEIQLEPRYGVLPVISKAVPRKLLDQRHNLESKCVAALVRLHPLWCQSKEGTKFSWILPESWKHTPSHISPYEDFLRARWGDGLIAKIGCPKEEIGWWRATKSQSSTLNNDQPTTAATTEVTPSKPSASSASNPAQTKIKKKKETRSLFATKRGQHWLPVQYSRMKYIDLSQTTHEIKKFQFFKSLIQFRAGYDFKWYSLEQLLPPLLSPKYHIAKPSAMFEGQADMRHLGVATWFVTWNETFGMQMTKYLQHLFKRCKGSGQPDMRAVLFGLNMANSMRVAEYIEELEQIVMLMSQTLRHWSTPNSKDCAKTPEEFLLEPCVIIQLPWNQIVLHQWLAAALIEIMKFEISSVELRYWPLQKGDIENCARELLWLVSRAKERILLGLFLLSIKQENKKLESISSLLLDVVVLPVTPVLKFLCSGNASIVLKELKQAAFLNPCSPEEGVSMPYAVYAVDAGLQEIYVTHHWHFQFWLNDDHGSPFPLSRKVVVEDIVKRLKNTEPPPTQSKPTVLLPRGREDQLIGELWTSLNFEDGCLGNVLKILANPRRLIKILIRLGYFAETDEEPLCTILLGPEANRLNAADFVKCCELFAVSTFPLSGIEQNQSVLAWLVRLSAEVVETDQKARLTAKASQLLGRPPTLPGVDSDPAARDPSALLEQIRSVQSEVNNRKRDWLWNQLPTEWKQPVSSAEGKSSNVKSDVDDLQKIATDLSVRVGRIIFGLAQNSFKAGRGSSDTFADWQIVQYIVPGFISSLLQISMEPDTKRNRPRITNLVHFLECVVQHFEIKYLNWLKGNDERVYVENVPLDVNKHFILECLKAISKGRLWLEKITHRTYAFIGLGYEHEGFPGFDAFLDGLLWIMSDSSHSDWNVLACITARAWRAYGFILFEDLFKICKKAFPLPEPGSTMKGYPMLSKVYFATSVMDELPTLLTLQGIENIQLLKLPEYESLNVGGIDAVKNWQYYLTSMVVQSQGLLPMDKDLTRQKIEMFASDGQNILLDHWRLLVKIRNTFTRWRGVDIVVPSDDGDVPKVKALMAEFKAGKVSHVEKVLALTSFSGEGVGLSRNLRNVQASIEGKEKLDTSSSESEDEVVKEANTPNKKKKKCWINSKHANECRRCKKQEQLAGSFIICRECVKQQYPDVNYFCSSNCRDLWWKIEHMAEHLEFELGVSDLSAEKLNSNR